MKDSPTSAQGSVTCASAVPVEPGTRAWRRAVRGLGSSRGTVLILAGCAGTALLLGLLREAAVANVFGASHQLDAFLVAQTLPRMLGQDGAVAIVGACVPILVSLRLNGHTEAARQFARRLVSAVIAVAAALSAGALIFGDRIVLFLGPGLSPADAALACRSLAWLLPMMGFLALGGVTKAVLDARGAFLAPALMGPFISLGVIGSIALLYETLGIIAIAVGASLGAAAGLAAQAVRLLASSPSKPIAVAEPRTRVAIPLAGIGIIFANSATFYLGLAVDRYFASRVGPGSISLLNYAWAIAFVPQQLIAYPTSAILLPRIAASIGRGDWAGALALSKRASAWMVILFGAATAVVALGADSVVEIAFRRGAFGPTEVEGTASILRVAAIGFIAGGVNDVLRAAFLSMAKPRVVLESSLVKLTVKPFLSWALVGVWGVSGLVASTVIAAYVGLAYLWFAQRRWARDHRHGRNTARIMSNHSGEV